MTAPQFKMNTWWWMALAGVYWTYWQMTVILKIRMMVSIYSSAKILDGPYSGSADIDPVTGEIRYLPMTENGHQDFLIYSVCDLRGACDTAIVYVEVRMGNLPPEAENDVFSGSSDEMLIADVLANDQDPDGFLRPATLKLVDAPSNAYAVVENAKISYTPDPGFCGVDEFLYEICDDEGACSQALVEIKIDCSDPKAEDDFTFTQEGKPVSLHVLVNDDPGTGAFIPSTISFPVPAGHGDLSVDENNGLVTYTPRDAWCKDDAFEYQVCDQNNFCTQARVHIKGLCYTFSVRNDHFEN